MADIKSLIDKFNIFRTKDSILNDVAKDNGQITIDIKQPFSDDIDSNNSLKTKLETNIKDKLFNTEINNVGSNIFDEKIKPFDKGYNVSNTPDTDTKTPIDTTPIKPDTPTIEKNTADATAIQQEKIQQPEITTPKPKPTQQYKTITEQQNTKLTTDSLGNYMPIDFDTRKGTSYSGVGEQQIDEIFNRLDTPEKFDMFMQSVYDAYDQLKSDNINDNLNDKENFIFLPYSYDHENGNMNGIRLTFGGRQKEWAEKQLKILEKGIIDKQNEEWLSNLELPQPETTMDKITSNPWLKLFSFMQPPTDGMDTESKRILEEGQHKNRLNAIKWGLIENIKECKDILNKYYKDKSQIGTALSQKNIAETINNVIFPQIDLVKQSEIASIISKYKKNPKSLTPIENEIVKYYSDYVNALSVVANKTSTGYETTKAIETSLPFMADFLRFNFVGSATRGGTRAAMKIGGKGLARQIAKDTTKTIGARAFKLGEDILTAAGHTSVSPLTFTNMLEDYSQTMETNGQYTKNDLIRGGIEAFTENFSERMFGALKGILPKSNNAFVNSLFGNNPVIKSMQKHMNVGGMLEETAEEYAGAFVNTMFGFALGDKKLSSSFKEQLNNSVPTILSIGITVGLPQAIGMGIDFREIKNTNKRFNVVEDNLKQYFNKENSYLDINRYSDALKSLYINLNNAKNEEDKAEIKGKIAELNKTAANLAMEKGDSNGFNLISEYSIAAQNSFYVTNKAMSELKNMSEEDRTKLSDNAINKLKNDFTNNLNWSLISRAAAKNITDQNGKQHPTCFLYTDNGVTYVLNGQKDNMFSFVDVNGNTISKSADELRNNENLSVLHLNNLLSSFSNKELEDINSKFIDIAQYNAGYRYKVNDNGEIRYYTDNKDLIKSNIPYERIDRDKIESNLVGSYDLVRIDNITNAVEDMAKAFAEPAAEQTSAEQTSEQQPAQETIEQTAEQPQEQPQEQTTEEQETTQEPAQEQETTEQEPIQPTQQEIEPTQQQIEPAQEEDDSTALNGVPDIVDDTPQDARERGFRRVNGYKIDRQKPLQAVNGKEIAVRFSNDVIANGHVAVIDAEQLQPSHIQGVRNPLHFIDEAQPKERNDEASIVSAQRIAKNIRPEEITSSVTAYTGAPIINARGETIQGNNRSDALRLMWSQNKDQAEKYKQYLIDHAQEFGLNAEDIAAMERPILVNMIDVSDEDAIALGQYVAQDTESGGLERIKPKNAVQKMGADMRTFANLLLSSNDDEISFAGLIDKNGVDVLNWLGQKGYITPTQYKSAFDTKGYITAEAKNDLRGIMYQSIFQGGSTRLEEMFNTMPAKAQKAILATAFRDYDSPKSESMIVEIQNSIRAYYALSQSADFMNAKTYKDVRLAVEGWKKQYQIDDATGESYLPAENFSNFALLLATMYKGEKQTLIQGTFNKLYDLIQGTQEADLFETHDNTPRTLSQAIKEVLNIDYNGQQRSNVLVGDTTTSQRGEQGSTRDAATRERTKDGERTADSAGGIDAESRIAQNEQENTESQSKKPNIPKTEEAALRDALIDKLREAGIDVITDVEDAQRLLDEANGNEIRQQKTTLDAVIEARDKEYLEAVRNGDLDKAQRMVVEAAKVKGYNSSSQYQGTSAFNGAAPWGNGYFLTKEERKEAWDNDEFEGDQTLGDYIHRGIDMMNLDLIALDPRHYRAADPMRKEAIDNVRNAIQKKSETITMYRSVPSDVKEGSFRNGDWVTPSRAYAVDNAKVHGWGDNFNIIEQKVPVDEIWWNGDDIAEWGYGREEDFINDKDFAYKNTKNNRKLLDAVTYDDNGNVIPLSKRFNARKSDIRFFRTADGDAYGFTVGGKIYIDPRIANADTPIHEYAHLWASAMQKLNPNEWENIVKLMKGTPIWEEVKINYPELTTDNEIADEVLAFYSGIRGAKRLREEHAKILKGNGNVVEKVKAINAIKRVREALKRFWKNVAEWFGIHFTTAEEVADKVLSDLLNGVNPTLAGVEDDIRFEENSEEADIVARAKADGTYMKAPNGKQSNLSPRQWVQVRTKAFKDWFGDWENDPDNSSKVVDKNGEPMVVYHGTTNDETEQEWNEKLKSYDTTHKQFTIFRRNTNGESNYGMFFNSDMDNAFAYGYYTYSVYLNIKNPLEIDCDNSSYNEIKYNGEIRDTYEWAKWAEKNGYDGVIFRNIRDGVDFNSMNEPTNDYVTFASNQIKSATDNVGTFDQNNPDIRYQFVGEKGADNYDVETIDANSKSDTLYRIVDDKSTIERLDAEPKIKAYRAMQVIDGRLYSPMAAKIDGKLSSDNPFDTWTEAEETVFDFTPEQISAMEELDNSSKKGEVEIIKGKLRYRKDSKTGKGKLQFHLVKGDGSELWAAYNPYIHSSLMMLNDQFTSAYKRPNIVVVEVEIPKKELNKEYRAKFAKDTVGMADWKVGPVARQLPSDMSRKVILSRWSKVKRIVPYSEVADNVAALFSTAEQKNGKKLRLPIDSFHPELRKELEKRGFEFEYGTYTKEKTDKKGNLIKAWDEKTEEEKQQDYNGAAYIDDAAIKQLNDEFGGKWIRRDGVSNNDELSQSELQRMAERINELADKLQLDNVEVVTDASTLKGNKKRAKGFYSKSTDKITIVIPNNSSVLDVEQTLLHEAVAHYGLRQLFGEHFDTFLDNVFNNADKAIRKSIIAIASKNGFDLRTATEEYLATLAENTEFEAAQKSGWWQKIKDLFLNMLHRIGFEDFGRVTLTDNELRYILWRSYENLANGNNSILGDATDEAKQKELGVGNYAATNKNSTTTNENDIRYRRASNRSVISSRFERQAEIQREEKNTKSAAKIVLGNANVVLNDTDIFDEQYQNAIDNNLIDENVSPLIDSFGITWGYQLKNGVIVINKDVFVSDILDKRVKDNLSLLISSLMKTNKTFFKEGISFFKKLPIWVLYKNDTKSNEDTIKEIINDILLGNTSIDTNKLELLKQYTVQDMNDILDNSTKWFEKFEGISSNMFAGNSISDILDTTLGDLMPKEITTTQEGKRLNWFSKLGIDIRSKLFDSLDWFRVVSDKTKDKTASELYDAMIVHTKRVQGKIDIFDKEYVRPIIDTIQSMLGKDFGNSALSLDLIQEYFAIKSLLGRTASLYKEKFGEYLTNPESKKPPMFDEFKQIYDEITEDEIRQRINEMGEKSSMPILQKVDIDYLMEEVRRTLAAEMFVKQYVYSSANTLNQGLQGEQSLGLINEVTNEPYSELYQLLYSDEQSSQTMHSPIEIIEQADILIDRAGLREEFDFIGNQIQAILNYVNIERFENGLMSSDTFAKRQLMKDFVNQRGENSSEGNLYEITAKQKANEKMKGKDWFNPNSITSIIAVAQTEIATMEKELLAQRLSYFLTNPNNFDVLSQYGMIIDEKETLNEELSEDERNYITDKNIVLLYGERHTDKDTKGQVDKKKINILKRNDDGTFTKVTISFDNKFIGLEEFVKFVNNNFKYEELRGLSKAAAPLNAWLSRIYTILSPVFSTKNFFRDLMVTPWLPAKELNGKNSQYVIKNFYNAFNNLSFILKMSFAEKSFSKKGFENKLKARSQELFEYYLEYSKQHSIFSIEDQIGALSKENKTLQDIERALSSKENKFIKFTERALLIKFMQHYAELFENLHKFSAYVTLRKLGYGEERSAQIANNATLNYDRSGSIGRQLNAIIPFAKAALGGFYRTKYLLPKYNPKGFLQRVITLAVLGVMQGLMYDPDDDDISEFARKSGMVFGSFLYPLLPEELAIVRPVRALVIVMAGKKSPAYFKQELMESTIDLVPIASDALRGAFSYNPLTNKPEFDAGQLFANTDKMTAFYALAMLASYINENKNSFGKNVLLNEETNTDKTRYGRTKQDYGLYDYIARLYNSIINGIDIDDRAAMSNKIGKNGERLMTIAKEDVEFVINNYIPFGRLYAYTAEIIYDAVNDKRINKGHIPLIGGLFAQKSFGKDYYLVNNIKYELKDFTNDFSQSQIEDIKTNILDKAGIREGIRYKALKDNPNANPRMLDKAKRNMNDAFNVFILDINNLEKTDFTEDEQKFMLYSFLNSSIMKKALSIGEDTLNKHTAKRIDRTYDRYKKHNNENYDADKENMKDAVKKFKKELYDKSITEEEFNNKLNSLYEPMFQQIKLRAKFAGYSIE